ncbi:cobyric acid synthase [Anaerotalea alkaliphila]|uniref:Cobyric acid synthase n=1 Tax=Anaerotalea alkaliphila TaxID=2662126 RepID=A0A7X5HXB1_9FIRM|nr:cobyric acid synthase [Anaerotalea alkaliphila]NDL68347.1 cobyric acid synthase [Anaerotalea alkaliphila]
MAKSIMIQGTTSNAGKSLFTAALCRIFKQDGYRVAPFKSQNMALNSYITKEGLEMGRAQVVQAEAAGIEPDVVMNPILLKPTSDCGSQVIVNGEVLGNMSASEYFQFKHKLKPDIMKAYNHLDENYDIIVIEGAGSPAEINLKADDIVNMGMAKMANAPVLLIGDIDRGGVFASVYGTIMLLTEDERKMMKGTVINKFRGSVDILAPGLRMIEELTNVSVAGVVPYMNIDIDDEDSLSERMLSKYKTGLVDIAVIRLPKISNFTDFNVFERIPEVSVRYVCNSEELDQPDMIILPGTKNTISDLLWLRQNGLEALIKKHAAAGTLVFGICGGYQMLGTVLDDPDGVECGGKMNGINLIEADTVFYKDKVRTQITGKFHAIHGALSGLSGMEFSGYEIHMGKTTIHAGAPVATILDTVEQAESTDGCQIGNIYGSYVHGIFDASEVANTVVKSLMEAKGIAVDNLTHETYGDYKEKQYDALADTVRKSVNMDLIYKILEEGV